MATCMHPQGSGRKLQPDPCDAEKRERPGHAYESCVLGHCVLWHACVPAANPESRAETRDLPPSRKLGNAPASHCGLCSLEYRLQHVASLTARHNYPCGNVHGFPHGSQSDGHTFGVQSSVRLTFSRWTSLVRCCCGSGWLGMLGSAGRYYRRVWMVETCAPALL